MLSLLWSPYSLFCTVVFTVIGIAGIIGNLLIIGAIVLENQLKSFWNIFIVNLAVVDFLVTVDNILPSFGCNTSGGIVHGGCLVTILSLSTMTCER